jgi:predicted cupin superfamily sugar epimerase
MDAAVPLLSSRFTVCAIDRRGRGASGDSPDCTLPEEAEDGAAVVHARQSGPVFQLGHSTSGHWLFLPGSFSSFHRVLNGDELWLIHAGKLHVHVIEPFGKHMLLRLGLDVRSGERPVAAVPAGHWQAAELPADAQFAFGTNVCAPPFSFDEFSIAERDVLIREHPAQATLVRRLTR